MERKLSFQNEEFLKCRRAGATMARGGSQEGQDENTLAQFVAGLRAGFVVGFGRCYRNGKGYWIISGGPDRKKYLHRLSWERIAGCALPPNVVVHHMWGKDHFCGPSLVALPACLHDLGEPLRCPVTGVFMSIDAYTRRYGEPPPRFARGDGKSSLSTG